MTDPIVAAVPTGRRGTGTPGQPPRRPVHTGLDPTHGCGEDYCYEMRGSHLLTSPDTTTPDIGQATTKKGRAPSPKGTRRQRGR